MLKNVFPAEAKAKAEKMIHNIILAYQNRSITNLDVSRNKSESG
jgi:predicted metalloendopeptidase